MNVTAPLAVGAPWGCWCGVGQFGAAARRNCEVGGSVVDAVVDGGG